MPFLGGLLSGVINTVGGVLGLGGGGAPKPQQYIPPANSTANTGKKDYMPYILGGGALLTILALFTLKK